MAGGSLHDTWDTRGDLPVRRPECCEPGCRERPAYRDDDTGEPICGPHLRERRREARGEAAPPSPPPEDTTMPAPGTRTAPPCARPGCGRKNLAHGLCDVCRSRARARDLPVNRPLTADEIALLDLPAPEALAKQGKKKERASPTKKPAPAAPEAVPAAPSTPPSAAPLGIEFWRAEAEGLQKRIDDVNAALEEAAVDPENEREEGDAIRELARRLDAEVQRSAAAESARIAAEETLAAERVAFSSGLALQRRQAEEALAAIIDAMGCAPRSGSSFAELVEQACGHGKAIREAWSEMAAKEVRIQKVLGTYGGGIEECATRARTLLDEAGISQAFDGSDGGPVSRNDARPLDQRIALLLARELETAGKPDTAGDTAAACRRDLFRALGGDEEEDVPSWPTLIRDVEELVAAQEEDPEALAERAAEAYERQARAMEQRAAALRAFARGEEVARG